MTRSIVVLPEPEGPSIVKNSPCETSRSMPSTATTSPYDLRTLSSRTSAGCVDKRLLQDLETPGEIVVGDDQRDEDPDDVSERAAGEEDETALACGFGRALGEVGGGLFRLAVGDELEGEHRADAPHLADLVDARGEVVEARADARAELFRVRAELVGG